MKTLIRSISIAAMAVLTAFSIAQGYHATLSDGTITAAHADSAKISNMLVDARTHAKLAAADADLLFSSSREMSASYQIFGARLVAMRDNVNALGKVKTELVFMKDEGSPWQKIAIDRIDLQWARLALQLTETIHRFGASPMRMHMPNFQSQVKATYDEANNTALLIGNFVEYDKARANQSSRIAMLEKKLGLSPAYRSAY